MSLYLGELLNKLKAVGFQHSNDVVLAFTGGSRQYGASVEEGGDLDIFGVFIEHPEKMLGLDKEEHFVTSTSDNSQRNTLLDQDCKMYGLRHWAAQAAKGNPTALGFLFCPSDIIDFGVAGNNPWLATILPSKHLFLASSHASAYLGYGQAQLRRLQGQGTGKHGQRNELIEKHGYDSKAAMHMIRMGYEGLELLETGRITYPRPEVEMLKAIRQGRYKLDVLEKTYADLESSILKAKNESCLPAKVNRTAISALVTKAYLQHWTQNRFIIDALK